MNKILALITILMIAGCGKRSVELQPPYVPVSCQGKVTEMSRYELVVQCDDGTVATYKTYKYGFNRNVSH